MSASDLVDHFKLDAFYDSLSLMTHETLRVPDQAQHKRQVTVVKQWKRTKSIGRGAFGTVWLDRGEGDEVRAVKEVVKEDSGTLLKINCKRELLALSRLSKYNNEFVRFYGWFENDTTVFLVMEYLQNGDLEKYINPKLNELDARSIIRQVLEGLKILHEMGWVHRDIKPQNIFVVEAGPSWWVKIGDFGISKRLHPNGNGTHTVIGTPDYLAPEISIPDAFESDDNDGYGEQSLGPIPAVDIWSLACMLYRIFANKLPFQSQKELRAYCKGRTQIPLAPLIKRQISEEGIEVVRGMLEPQPETRWTVTATLNHTWLKDQESSDGTRIPVTDEVFPNALSKSGPRIAANPGAYDMESEEGSHAKVEPNPSLTSPILFRQVIDKHWQYADGEELDITQHLDVSKWTPVLKIAGANKS